MDDSFISLMKWPIIGVIAFIVFAIVLMFIVIKHGKRKKNKFTKVMMKKLPNVEYTAIISSSNGYCVSNGNNSIYEGGPTTKFLIVYKSGEKEIVTLSDEGPLFNEYVKLLRIKS